jgi:ERCC4-related helicase
VRLVVFLLLTTSIFLIVGLYRSNSSPIIQSLTVLCAIFNCLTITTVSKKENEEELEQYVSQISEDEIICIDKQKAFDTLRSSIEKELKNLICDLFTKKDTNPHRIFPEKNFDMNGYEQNLELLKQREQKNQHFSFVLLIDYILPIYRHIKALIDLTPELVLSDLKDYFEIKYKKREHPMDIDTLIYEKCQNLIKKKLTELEESQHTLSNPKLDKLVELLKKHAEKANSRSKLIFVLIFKVKFKIILALILVERTFYAKKICEYLQNHSELKVCEMLSFFFILIQLFLIVNRTLLNHVGLLVKMVLTMKNQTKMKIQH